MGRFSGGGFAAEKAGAEATAWDGPVGQIAALDTRLCTASGSATCSARNVQNGGSGSVVTTAPQIETARR
jgi:hypothetical protein